MTYLRNFIKTHPKETLLVIFLTAASMPTLFWMSDRWFAEDSYYSHGVLVPFVSLFLIWKNKDVLRKKFLASSVWGMRLFIAGIFLYWLSALLHIYFSSGFSIIIIIAGLILHFYGRAVFMEVLFPLIFLSFMVPLPLIMVACICFKLKVIAAHLATYILNIIGLPAIQSSSLIKMRHCAVLVEDSCGGFRSLISLTALGSIFAYQLKSNYFKKGFLFLSAIPIATLANTLRIVFLSAVGEILGTEYTQGAVHNISGYLVFAFAFIFLFTIKRFLE